MTGSHFTSTEKLKAFLHADQVTQLFSKIPEAEQEQHFAAADSIITARTGVAPTGDDDASLVAAASAIVIWFVSGTQQWSEQNKVELERRRSLYENALAFLDSYQVPIENPTSSAFGADQQKMESW